jgi:hypothetical protein
MTDHSFFTRSGVLLALALASLQAQALATAAQDLRQAASGLDCQQLARMPNAPMTMEACEAQKAAFANLGAAADTPSGARAGDAALDCPQIVAELQASNFAGVGAATAAEGVTAGKELRDAQAAAQAQAVALSGRQTGETAAASLGPNAVQGAVAAKHAAEQAVLQQSASAAIRPAQTRAIMANAASAQELAASLQANPRVATLMQLAAARNCQLP